MAGLGTSGQAEAGLVEFLEKSRQAWVGMMRDKSLRTFDQHEERAWKEGRLLSRLLLEARLAQEAALCPGDHDQQACCPKCGQPAQRLTAEATTRQRRRLRTRVGPVQWDREQWKCTTCRVVFFPRGPDFGARDGGLLAGGDPPGGA